MDRKAIDWVQNYAEDQGVEVQITYSNDIWTADFRSIVHAHVVYEELNDNEMAVTLFEDLRLR